MKKYADSDVSLPLILYTDNKCAAWMLH